MGDKELQRSVAEIFFGMLQVPKWATGARCGAVRAHTRCARAAGLGCGAGHRDRQPCVAEINRFAPSRRLPPDRNTLTSLRTHRAVKFQSCHYVATIVGPMAYIVKCAHAEAFA